MGIGLGVFLIAVGAILAFAVNYHIAGLDIAVVGWILMIAGLAGTIVTLAVWAPRRRRASASVRAQHPISQDRTETL